MSSFRERMQAKYGGAPKRAPAPPSPAPTTPSITASADASERDLARLQAMADTAQKKMKGTFDSGTTDLPPQFASAGEMMTMYGRAMYPNGFGNTTPEGHGAPLNDLEAKVAAGGMPFLESMVSRGRADLITPRMRELAALARPEEYLEWKAQISRSRSDMGESDARTEQMVREDEQFSDPGPGYIPDPGTTFREDYPETTFGRVAYEADKLAQGRQDPALITRAPSWMQRLFHHPEGRPETEKKLIDEGVKFPDNLIWKQESR